MLGQREGLPQDGSPHRRLRPENKRTVAVAAHPQRAVAHGALAVSIGASAQVASLVSPDESPDPETTEVVLEFEEEDGEEGFLAALRGADLADWVEPNSTGWLNTSASGRPSRVMS